MTDSGEEIIKVVIHIPGWLEKPIVFLLLLYRRLRFGYAFRRIALTQGKYAIVDPDDYERLKEYRWYAARGAHTFYAQRSIQRKNANQTTFLMHREIIKPADDMFVDHINQNGLDNRKANLRLATHAQNNCHRPIAKRPNSHSKYRGVTWCKTKNKWLAQIKTNRKGKHIGYFKDEIEAAKAYDRAAKKYHGEFAVLNFKA